MSKYVRIGKPCIECGRVIRHSYYSGLGFCCRACYNKSRWEHLLDDKAIIISGKCYHIKDVDFINEFDRVHYKIQMLQTGEIIETNNLWYEGDVPAEYAQPDNAIFLYKV